MIVVQMALAILYKRIVMIQVFEYYGTNKTKAWVVPC